MATITKFETGKTYSCRSLCDYECIYSFTIVSRTDAQVTISSNFGKVRRKVRICNFDHCEMIDPLGRYSMSPVLRASKPDSAMREAA